MWWFRPTLVRSLLALMTVLLFLSPVNAQRTSSFYDTVNDIATGIDYYEVLDVSPQASERDIKKAFRTLGMKYHPDKDPSAEAQAKYLLISRAYTVLLDETTRAEFDDLRTNGIPWHEMYYGRHMHRWGAPQHDIRWVLFWLMVIFTALKHFAQHQKHIRYHAMVKNTNAYKKKRSEMLQASGLNAREVAKLEKKKEKKGLTEEDLDIPELEVNLLGAEAPTWMDLLPIAMVLWIFKVFRGIYILFSGRSEEERMKIMKKQMEQYYGQEFTDEEFKEEMARLEEKQQRQREKLMNSTKYKRYRRWVKANPQT